MIIVDYGEKYFKNHGVSGIITYVAAFLFPECADSRAFTFHNLKFRLFLL